MVEWSSWGINYIHVNMYASSMACITDISAPTVVNITGSTNVLEHSSVSYQCSADGFPAPTKM